MNSKRAGQLTAVAVAAAMMCAACGPAGADKSGGTGAPRILVMANTDGSGLIGAPAMAHFVQQVDVLSKGRLKVRVQSRWGGGGNEPSVIKDVAAGRADLGWAGTRAFDSAGIDSFRPMQAPFLVNSYPAEAAVVKDPIAQEMLNGLHPKGLTGLALAADQLRMPAAAAKPLLTPADFRGLRFRTETSKIQTEALQALGAEPVRTPVQDAGSLDGVETMWWTYQANSQYGFMPFVTRNAALWPRSVVLFANTQRLDRLDGQDRNWVVRAAADASAWSTVHAGDTERDQIDQVCRFGAKIATATAAQLAALRRAAEPIYAALRAEPAQARTLARIETLVRTTGPGQPTPIPAGCAYRPGDEQHIAPPEQVLTGPGRPGDLPAGTYRYAVSPAELLRLGLTDHDATINSGVWTWTLKSGNWSYQQHTDNGDSTCAGWYSARSGAVAFTTSTLVAGGTCAPGTWTARWTIRTRLLTWRSVSIADFQPVFAPAAWQKIS